MLPGVLVGPIASVLLDRWNRKQVINIADGVGALLGCILALLFWLHLIQIWHVYLAMFIRSIASNFQSPAVQSYTSLMVPNEQLARVHGLNQMLQRISMIAAPPLAAWLISLLPFEGIMAIDVVPSCQSGSYSLRRCLIRMHRSVSG